MRSSMRTAFGQALVGRNTTNDSYWTNRLSLNLSLCEVGPFNVVPLIDRTMVELSPDRKTWPLKPSSPSSQPNGKL